MNSISLKRSYHSIELRTNPRTSSRTTSVRQVCRRVRQLRPLPRTFAAEEGKVMLFCKGADSIIFYGLSKNGKMYEGATTKHLNDYGENGLRTLALSYRKLEESEYTAWNNEFQKAKTSVGNDRDVMLEKVSEMMEKELVLVGATAVEDKLQKGVPQCIDKLAQAGLKLWVLTGDKMETAINIGFACSLLRQGMKHICIAAMNVDGKETVKENILNQITNASLMIKREKRRIHMPLLH